MQYHIALSGLDAAQKAIQLVGSNIANASTEGYHKQTIRLSPEQIGDPGNSLYAGGVSVTSFDRAVDVLIEAEITRQQPQLGQNAKELATLRLVENALGDLDTQGLTVAMDTYFNSLRELASQPNSDPLRYQAVWAAEGMATEFRNISTFLNGLEQQLVVEARTVTSQANGLIREIGELNSQIGTIVNRGGNANSMLDRRDQAILELGRLVDIDLDHQAEPNAIVDVKVAGMQVVVGNSVRLITSGLMGGNLLGLSLEDSDLYSAEVAGGKLGALVNLRNSILPEIRGRLDALASDIINRTNAYHVQGVGLSGSFTDLTGLAVSSEPLSQWEQWGQTLTEGTLNVRVTDKVTGDVTLYQIDITGDSTVASIAQDLDALAELKASMVGGALHIESADPNAHTFDFLPAPVLDTASSAWTGSAGPVLTGTYTGTEDHVYSFSVVSNVLADGETAQVGATSHLGLEVRNSAGELVRTLNVGVGYAADDSLDVGDGLYLSLPVGTLVVGEQFEVAAPRQTDGSGFLAAAGLNTFFSGSTAADIGLRADILADPRRLAGGLTPDASDNLNISKMSEVGTNASTTLEGISPRDYFNRMTADLAQNIAFRQARAKSLQGAVDQLSAERDRVSGVDINEEAAKLLVYQKMFQAVAKVLSAQTKMVDYLMEVI